MELLITVALAGVIDLLLIVGITTSSRLFSDQRTTTHISVQNRLALDEITNQIRTAVEVTTCIASICGTDIVSNNIQLVLKLWPIDINGDPFEPTVETEYDYVVYKRSDTDNTKLVKEVFPGTGSDRRGGEDILASELGTDINIINLQFDYDVDPPGATKVTITLRNEDSSIYRTHSISQTATAILRNRSVAGLSATLPDTSQTLCYDLDNPDDPPINCTNTGQDGEYDYI